MFNYTQLPDELFTIELFSALSLHAKVLYSFMLRRVSISKDNNWIDESGDVYIYYRVDEIMEKFNCSNKTAAKIISELEEIGLIEKRRQGQGKPDIIYVNKFSALPEEQENEPELPIEHMELLGGGLSDAEEGISDLNPEVKKVHFQKCKKFTSGSEKNTSLEVKKVHANYKENNYIEKINSSSLSPPNIQRENIRLIEEEKEKYRRKLKYQNAERAYSAQTASAVFDELIKRNKEYQEQFSPEMFMRICKAVSASREPILSMPGFINWCLDRISFQTRAETNPFCQFPQRSYDYKELERNLLDSGREDPSV
ncbi:MAG: replication initiator protein A [Lachnospiraceae bacterium]|nr:replication initiator protein A [Lachnospiraceae bacterium]